MPRQKAEALPDYSAFNLRKRAEQMAHIASAMEEDGPRKVLLSKAESFLRMADELENSAQQGRPDAEAH